MRTRSAKLSLLVGLVLTLVLGACTSSGLEENAGTEASGDNGSARDSASTSTPEADPGSIPVVPITGPIQTVPPGDPKPVASKAPQTVPPADGFEGNPPSFPDFTFTASRVSDTSVTVTGSGCAGGTVHLYPSGSGSEEGSDPLYADPDSGGNWSTSGNIAAGTLKGTCVAVGAGGQSHVGGSHTVTVA